MSTTSGDTVPPQAHDAAEVYVNDTISRSLKTMLAHYDLDVTDLPDLIIGLAKSTIYRRLKGDQDWKADEVWSIAELFGLPVEQFYTGNIRPFESHLASAPLRLSRDIEAAGHEPYPSADSHFSGSDIDRLCRTARTSAA